MAIRERESLFMCHGIVQQHQVRLSYICLHIDEASIDRNQPILKDLLME